MRRRRNGRIFKSLLIKIGLGILGVLVIISFFLLIKSNIFNINKIDISAKNIECANNEELKQSSQAEGQNFFFLKNSIIENNVKKKFYCVKSVQTDKYFPDKVNLQVLGRQPFAVLISVDNNQASASALLENISTPSAQLQSEGYVIDDEGVVFQKTREINAPKIFISDLNLSLGWKTSDKSLNSAVKIIGKIKEFKIEINEAYFVDNYLIIFTSRPKIIFGLTDKVDIQLASLQLILNEAKIDFSKLEFIDLRFDKPVVKFAPKN